MDFEGANEIWKYEDQDIRLKSFLKELVNTLDEKPLSHRDSYLKKILRNLFEEKELLGDFNG